MKLEIMDFAWRFFSISMLACYVFRKIVLAYYGYEFSLFDVMLRDGKKLKDLISKTSDKKVKRWLRILNYSVPVFYLLFVISLSYYAHLEDFWGD